MVNTPIMKNDAKLLFINR